ncbi:KxYKxGKxW signal peptide domain-containing protein [Weissella confusa]|uniref:Uncharacterized protein n=1 Tax=Weissella confusa TaxID=1583 RepID=A0A4Z0RXH6_WEICO|nr:KxYKxGKxW signal peptide domain-containing protein [Weissella confusa]TGE73626.1 hypothetical protein C6P11_04490 [Weissella confusa]
MMKKNVQSKGHFKMYKAGKKWVSYGLSVMGVALVVGTPVMSATLQLTTPETVSAASVQETDFTKVPASVLTAASTEADVDLSNNGEFSAWLADVVKNWDNWSDQQAARNALADLGRAFAQNKNLKSVDLSGTFAAANAADKHNGHDAAQLFWEMQLSNVKTASFETLDLSNNNFTPELTNTVYAANGINTTVKHLLFGNSSAELIATIHANGNNNYAADGHHGFGGKFIQADVSDTEMVPNDPQYLTSEAVVPNDPQYLTSEAVVPNDPQYLTSSAVVPNDPQYLTSEAVVPNDPQYLTSSAVVPNDPQYLTSSAVVPNDPQYLTSSAVVPNDPILTSSAVVPNEPILTSSAVVPNDPILTSSAAVPNEPIYSSSAVVPNDPILTSSAVVPNDPILTSSAVVPNDPILTSSAVVPNDPIYSSSAVVPNDPIEAPANGVTDDDKNHAKDAMTDEAAKQNVAEDATVVSSIDDIAHAETPAALQQAVDRAAVAISNAVSLPETAAKGAQDKSALLVAMTVMASLVTFAFVQKRK